MLSREAFCQRERGRLLNSAEASWLHTLYITYAETLYRIACYRLQDANRAQDLLHSVFLAAAQKVPALQAHENPLGWLLRALNYELSHEFARQAKQTAQEQPLHPSPPVWHRRRPRPWGWPRCCRSSSPPGPGNSAPVLRGRAVLPGDRPASGGAGFHLRHLALPGQKALPRLSVPFPRFSRLRGVSMSHTTSSARRAAAPAPGDDLIPGGNLPAPPPGASDDPGGPAAPRFFRRGILAAAAGHPSRLLPPSPRPRLEAMGPWREAPQPWPPWSSFSPPRQRRAPPRPPCPFPGRRLPGYPHVCRFGGAV